MENVFIYGLIDPLTGQLRYIGKSNNPRRRFIDHYQRCKESPNHRNSWLLGLKNKGLRPELFIIDEVGSGEWIFWEMFYINLFKSWGFSLVNMTDGGDNPPISKKRGYKHSPESRKRMSESQKGNKNNLGKKRSEATKKKLSNALKGKMPPNKGIPHSLETKIKIGLKSKGRQTTLGFKFSEESKKKMSESRIGIKLSEETRMRMSVAKTGIVMDRYTRNKIAQKVKNRPRNERGVFIKT